MPNVKHVARVGDLADVRGHPFIHIIGIGSSNVPELAIVGNLAPAHIVSDCSNIVLVRNDALNHQHADVNIIVNIADFADFAELSDISNISNISDLADLADDPVTYDFRGNRSNIVVHDLVVHELVIHKFIVFDVIVLNLIVYNFIFHNISHNLIHNHIAHDIFYNHIAHDVIHNFVVDKLIVDDYIADNVITGRNPNTVVYHNLIIVNLLNLLYNVVYINNVVDVNNLLDINNFLDLLHDLVVADLNVVHNVANND